MRRIIPIAVIMSLAGCVDRPAEAPTAPDAAPAKGGPGVKSVTVSPASASIQVGATVQLTATLKPGSATAPVAWGSSNVSVAAVSSTGLVTGVAAGTATITATAGGKSGGSTITVTAPPGPGEGVTVIAAGDVATCGSTGDDATAALLDGIPGTVLALGDLAYESGTATEFANCYDPSWGRHKSRTRPAPGNHEYQTAGAAGYYGYFGAAAGDPAKGYYSFDLGDWHIVVLNSNIAREAGSLQEQWLRADLAASSKACTLAFWHHPRFSSATHGNNTSVGALWTALYEYHAEVVLGGHDHSYERFAPQTPAAVADLAHGIREFVVGTGGRGLYSLGTLKANSEVFYNSTWGVLKLTLRSGAYDWQFIPTSGGFSDSGTGNCH